MGVFAERGAFGSVIRGDVSHCIRQALPSRMVQRDRWRRRTQKMTLLAAAGVKYSSRVTRAQLLATALSVLRRNSQLLSDIAKFQKDHYESLPKIWGKGRLYLPTDICALSYVPFDFVAQVRAIPFADRDTRTRPSGGSGTRVEKAGEEECVDCEPRDSSGSQAFRKQTVPERTHRKR